MSRKAVILYAGQLGASRSRASIRVDWGDLALHDSGFENFDSFENSHHLHLSSDLIELGLQSLVGIELLNQFGGQVLVAGPEAVVDARSR